MKTVKKRDHDELLQTETWNSVARSLQDQEYFLDTACKANDHQHKSLPKAAKLCLKRWLVGYINPCDESLCGSSSMCLKLKHLLS